jgi:hypothetical protein
VLLLPTNELIKPKVAFFFILLEFLVRVTEVGDFLHATFVDKKNARTLDSLLGFLIFKECHWQEVDLLYDFIHLTGEIVREFKVFEERTLFYDVLVGFF